MGTQPTTSSTNELTRFRLLFPTIELLVPCGTYLVGREPNSCDVIIRRDSVSRVHCLLTATPTSLLIRDLQSQNGVYVNGNRVRKAILQKHDRVRVGSARFLVAIDDELTQDDSRDGADPSTDRPTKRPSRQPARPSLGILSQSSIEIPADSLGEDDFEENQHRQDKLPAATLERDPTANETAPMDPAAVQKQIDRDRKPPPQPLNRTRLPESGAAPPPKETSAPAAGELLSSPTGRLALLLVAGWILYLLFMQFTSGRGRDREIARRLTEIGTQIRQLREQSAPQDAWDDLRTNIDPERKTMVEYLEDHASTEDPVKQLLLRAARDCLPRMLGISSEPSWYEERFHEYLAEARQELNLE